jgi:hypothetical protein
MSRNGEETANFQIRRSGVMEDYCFNAAKLPRAPSNNPATKADPNGRRLWNRFAWPYLLSQISKLSEMLRNISGVRLVPRFFTMEETLEDGPSNCLQIVLPTTIDARALAQRLRERSGNSLAVAMEVVQPGEEIIIGQRILEEVKSCGGNLGQHAPA